MKKNNSVSWLGLPATLWFLFFIAGPLFFILLTSLQGRSAYGQIDWNFSAHSYGRILSWNYLKILLSSVALASTTTLLCFFIGFAVAWKIAVASARMQNLWIGLLTVPFLLNLIIRVYAIRIFVGYDGPLVQGLQNIGIIVDPFSFSQNQFLVVYGMVTSYLPFMVFPIYAGFEKFDFALVDAHFDLGGSHWNVAWKVIIPNMRPAIATGILMVFVPALGEFVIPDLLGGAKNMYIGNLITEQFLKARDWPMGAALTVVMIFILGLLSWSILKFGNAQRLQQRKLD